MQNNISAPSKPLRVLPIEIMLWMPWRMLLIGHTINDLHIVFSRNMGNKYFYV